MSDGDKKAAWNEWLATDEGKSWQAENKAPVSFLVPTSAARAELQVSLLNEIGLTLTAVAKQAKADGVIAGQRYGALLDWSEANGKGLSNLFELVAEQAETLKTYKLSLEGIQGLLVDLDAKLETLPDRDNMTNALHLVIEGHHKSLESVYSKLALIDMKAGHLCRRKPRKAGKRKRVKR